MYEDPTGHSLTLATIIATLASATYAFGFSFLTTISSPEYSEMSVEEKINIGLRNGLISMGFDLITGVAGIALNAAKHAKYVVVANVALSIAHYGYIMENGRVVMQGDAASLLADNEISEHYLGIGKEGSKDYKEAKSYKRRQRIVW